MKTIIKWPGGKEKELSIIRKNTPLYSGRYIEPFVGGGSVFFDTNSQKCAINDKSNELINLYNCIKEKNLDLIENLYLILKDFTSLGTFVDENYEDILNLYNSNITIDKFINKYSNYFLSIAKDNNKIFLKELYKNLNRKISRSTSLENKQGNISEKERLENMEAAIKSAYYMYIRFMQNNACLLNKGKQAAVFFFIREYCYSSMFRYNSKGEFNVPYGGISYNKKDFKKKIDYLLSDEVYTKLNKTDIYCEDFQTFINSLNLTTEDFMFLDPPYDTDFSTYSQNKFGFYEQERLCNCLKQTSSKFLLIIKNTDFIYNLYREEFNIKSFEKKYSVSFMNRNNRDTQHLIVTNY